MRRGNRGSHSTDSNSETTSPARLPLNPPREGPHPITLPPMTVTKTPRVISGILLHEPWSYDLFTMRACHASYLCCPLLHFSRQLNALDPDTYTGSMYTCVLFSACLVDILTLRSPLAWYPGLGTALFGWYTRLHVRLKYRIEGLGAKDLLYTGCCANYAARQQEQELEKEGKLYPAPCCSTVSTTVEPPN